MNSLLRFTRRILGSRQTFGQADLFARHRQSYLQAFSIVRFFYLVGLFFAARTAINAWPVYIERESIAPLWPLFWANSVSLPTVANIVVIVLVAVALLAAVQPWRRAFRISFFVGFFLFVAYINSFGKIGHGFHAWLFVAFIFCFLPNFPQKQKTSGEYSISYRQQFLAVFFAAQAMVLLFYTMSGAWKIYVAIGQIEAGQIHAFHPHALAYLTADRLLQTNTWSLLGPFLIDYPIIGWPLHIGAMYIELFSLVVAFRPVLHRFWGVMLLLFHFGTIVILSVGFTQNMLLIGLLFVMSPFAPTAVSPSTVLTNLPLFGDVWRIYQKSRHYFLPRSSPKPIL